MSFAFLGIVLLFELELLDLFSLQQHVITDIPKSHRWQQGLVAAPTLCSQLISNHVKASPPITMASCLMNIIHIKLVDNNHNVIAHMTALHKFIRSITNLISAMSYIA